MLQITFIGNTEALLVVTKHNTNSILIQHTPAADQNNTSITLIPDHNFIHSSRRSFKGKVARLPQLHS